MTATAFSEQRFTELAKDRLRRFGTALTVLQSTESTNDYAADAAKRGAADGAVYLAEEQTRGRGRQGNVWTAKGEESLLFTILLRTDLPLEKVSALTLAVGLGVREGLSQSVESPLKVKWPNDVLSKGLKLAGILVETQSRGAKVESIAVGIGINVHATKFADEVQKSATSMKLLGAIDLEREAVLVNVLEALEEKIATYERAGLAPMAGELGDHDALLGKQIEVDGVGGQASGIDATGRLVVTRDDGSSVPVVAGTVRVLE